MQTLKPVIVYIRYDYEAEQLLGEDFETPVKAKEGYLPIEDVTPVEPEGCRLDDENEWHIFTHMRVDGKFAELALQLDLPTPCEAYRAAISSSYHRAEDAGEALRLHRSHGAAYFLIPTRFKRVGGDRKYDSQFWNTSAGMRYLHIDEPGQAPRTVRVCVHPSSLDDQNYRLILDDLALLHRQLLMRQSAGRTASVSERWEAAAKDLEGQADRMKEILKQLEAAPEQELVADRSRVAGYKVKKLTPKAAIDQAMGRRRLRTAVHRESFDIYEHRMLRTYLENLKKLAGQYRALEGQEREALAGEAVSAEALRAADARLDELVEANWEPPQPLGQLQTIRLKVRGIPQLLLARDLSGNKALVVNSFSLQRQPVLFCDGTYWPNQRQYLSQMTMRAQYNGRQTFFLRRCMDQTTQWWRAWNDTPGYASSIIVELRGIFEYQEVDNRRHNIAIIFLDGISYRGQELMRFADSFPWGEAQENLKRRLKDDLLQAISGGKLSDAADEIFYDTAIHRRAAVQLAVRNVNHDWEGIQRKADQLLNSPLLRGLRGKERLHTSNLFAKHRGYRRAYALMREKQAQFAGIDLWGVGSLPVRPTQSIYEVWCLLKMLSIWINEYGFTLTSPSIDTLTQQLLRHLRDGKKDKDKAVPTMILTMERGNLKGMELRLDYDTDRCFQEYGKEKRLCPDFFLKITFRGKTYRFCMDAKYRNYAPGQQTKADWYEDLFYVAWFKYIFRLRDQGEEIDGAYILHSDDASPGRVGGQSMGRYFWSRFGAEQREADPYKSRGMNGLLLSSWQRFVEAPQGNAPSGSQMLNRIRDELNGVEDCRLGAIRFTPGSDNAPDAAFRGLMQMIMEHFLGKDFIVKQNNFPGIYQAKCWSCGSESLQVRELATNAGFKKYYIICQTCQEFWVQNHCFDRECDRELGKHRHNYYRRKDNSVWNVVCPVCGKGLSRAE